MLELKPVTIETIPLLESYLQRYPRENCDYTITNLISWGIIYRVEYLIWQDRKDKGVPVGEAVQKEFIAIRDKKNLPYKFPFEK